MALPQIQYPDHGSFEDPLDKVLNNIPSPSEEFHSQFATQEQWIYFRLLQIGYEDYMYTLTEVNPNMFPLVGYYWKFIDVVEFGCVNLGFSILVNMEGQYIRAKPIDQ